MGSGNLGVALILRTFSHDHRVLSGTLFMDRTLEAFPIVFETMMCSPVRSTMPTHSPVIHRLINFRFAVVFWARSRRSILCLAIFPWTLSQHSTTGRFQVFPIKRSHGALPQWPMRNLDITNPVCWTAYSITGAAASISWPILPSSASLMHLN